MLRDTGSAQTLMLSSVLPLSNDSYTGANVLLRGVELGCIKVPLHNVCLKSELVSGCVRWACDLSFQWRGWTSY